MDEPQHAAMCVYCGQAVIYDTRQVTDMAKAHAQIVEHDQSCPKNPLVAEIASLRQRLSESEADASRYRYIRNHQYWMRSQGIGGDEPYSVIGVKFDYADDFQARAMLDYHIDRRIKAEQPQQRTGDNHE